ncbi:flagellin [Rubricella aquisinus]|uniref:Flagellin n=1 Tax=Rubricella aquisinus TaxID=2028108 RepID=A0A840WM73_9RHOB|nr:flagellin [Rubricella aquisinus]MBB5515223.1 flagellin [Rubricella aquisinus]
MSSILTNNSAMVALKTLTSINSNLQTVQNQIATGKEVGSSKDNSAIWAISTVMRSDVEGFKGISDSLSLAGSTVSVGRQAAETVTDLLTEIKDKIVDAQDVSDDDRAKIQTDITSLRDQITSVVNTAQFNGQNLLKGTEAINVLSSLDRAQDGTVTTQNITVNRNNLETNADIFGTGTAITTTASAANIGNTDGTATISVTGSDTGNALAVDINGFTVSVTPAGTDNAVTAEALETAINAAITNGDISNVTVERTGADLTLTNTNDFGDMTLTADADGASTATVSATTVAGKGETVTADNTRTVAEGDSFRVAVGGTDYEYVAAQGETMADVFAGLKTEIDAAAIDGLTTSITTDGDNIVLNLVNDGAAGVTLTAAGAEGGQRAGGLSALSTLDVSTAEGATAALTSIESLIQTSITAASEFGSSERRIEIQEGFVNQLSNALKSGIGALVDADMQEASARLQALQVQQQLGIQALSIANQAPQSVLSLFR